MIWQLRIVEGTKKRDNSMYNIIRKDIILEFQARLINFNVKFFLHTGKRTIVSSTFKMVQIQVHS